MNVATVSDLRKHAKKYLDRVVEENDILVLSRPAGRSVVVMPIELFNSGMDTTAYLMSSKANREHIERGIADIEAGRTVEKTLEELKQYEQA